MTVSPGIPVETLATRDDLWLLGEALQANWAEPLEIASTFKTAVESPIGKAEQRWGLIDTPIRSVSASLRGYSPEAIRALKAWATRTTIARTPFPLFSDQMEVVAAASAGATVVQCDTTQSRIGNSIRVAIISNPGKHELAKSDRLHIAVASLVQPSQISLDSPLPFSIVKGDLVIPLIESRLMLDHAGLAHTDHVAEIRAEGFETEGRTQLPSAAAMGTVTTAASYQGLPIFDLPIDWKQPIPFSVTRRGGFSSSGVASVAEVYGERGLVGFDLPLVATSRSEAWSIIRFFESRGGRLYPFWLPSPTTDYFEYGGGLTNTVLLFKTGGPLIDWQFRPYLLIELKTGEKVIRPVASVAQSLGLDIVTLSEGTPQIYAASAVRRVSPAYKVRFASDAMTEQWPTTQAMTTTLKVIESERESPVVINNIDEIKTTGFAGGAVVGACGPVPLFLLSDCKGVAFDIVTDTDLSAYVGKVVHISGGTICYEVGVVGDTGQDRTPVTVTKVYDSCLCCSPDLDSAGCCTGLPDGVCAFPKTLFDFGGLRVEFTWEIVDKRAGCCQDDNENRFRYIHQDRSISGSATVTPTLPSCFSLDAAHSVPYSYVSEAIGQGPWCPGGDPENQNDTYDFALSIDYDSGGSLSNFSFTGDGFTVAWDPAIDPEPVISTNTPVPSLELPTPLLTLCESPQGCITGGRFEIPLDTYSSVGSSGRCGPLAEPQSEYGLIVTFRLTRNTIC